MDDEQNTPTQQTQPKGIDTRTGKPFEPVEIPVPKRSTWDRVLGRATGLVDKADHDEK